MFAANSSKCTVTVGVDGRCVGGVGIERPIWTFRPGYSVAAADGCQQIAQTDHNADDGSYEHCANLSKSQEDVLEKLAEIDAGGCKA